MSDTKGALQSVTIWSGGAAAVAGLSGVLSAFGIISPGEVSELAAHAVALVGGILAVWRRITAKRIISGLF